MCGIAGVFNLKTLGIGNIKKYLEVMNDLQKHRGPDGAGIWIHKDKYIGLAHRRLSIIELSELGKQPMQSESGNWISFNGEIYNYLELRKEIGEKKFRTKSDTEVILKAYEKWGVKCVDHFIGMFAFALWDEKKHKLFCARDRFGIKPFYYAIIDNVLFFASEMKTLLPFLKKIETDERAFRDYITFQFCLENKTLFKGINELEPAHILEVCEGEVKTSRYWQVYYDLDWYHTEKYFLEQLDEILTDSVKYHVRSDVPIGGYVSGGIDSSAISAVASGIKGADNFIGFVGKFNEGNEYDESMYSEDVAKKHNFKLLKKVISSQDFIENIEDVIYYLDNPVAGPGSFCQYMVSQLVSTKRKVILGGQGGDEIFGGYTRYLIAYFEQCIKGAIDGTINSGKFIVTYQSIIPNLICLKNYKPMLKDFWSEGLFDPIDRRYFKLVNRSSSVLECIRLDGNCNYDSFQTFLKIFNADNVNNSSYFDRMTHFDFKTLLPALLQVEDRMSMAHGIESRVPLLDHRLVELVATIPANFKLRDGEMKYIFKKVVSKYLPDSVKNRTDKMGFPLPLNLWIKGELKEYIHDILGSKKALERDLVDNRMVLQKIDKEGKFSRNIWGMLSLEIWQEKFHDNAYRYHQMIN